MPQHESCKKRMRQSAKQNQYNRAVKSVVKTATRKFDDAEGAEAETAFRNLVSELDRAAKKGVIPSQRADRKKSRLAAQLAKKNA